MANVIRELLVVLVFALNISCASTKERSDDACSRASASTGCLTRGQTVMQTLPSPAALDAGRMSDQFHSRSHAANRGKSMLQMSATFVALNNNDHTQVASTVTVSTQGCADKPLPRDLPPVPGRVRNVIVILGGPTNDTKPGPWLEWRLRAAMALYQQHSPESTGFLLTGGQPSSYGSCAALSEASVMQFWLENAGISQGVWREDRSNNTLDNAELTWYRLQELRQADMLAPNVSLHIVTQHWHMVKARECFNVFFNGSTLHARFDSIANIADDTMALFEQNSYADMYRIQLWTWLPWQLGFNRVGARSSDVVRMIDAYASTKIEAGSRNAFFMHGATVAQSRPQSPDSPSSAWAHINVLQWDMFKATLSNNNSDDTFVLNNNFSRWGSLNAGHWPRYVTAFNPSRDSGDFLGLSCPGACGKRYDALRVVAFLQQPRSRTTQLQTLELTEAWEQLGEQYSPAAVAAFVLGHHARLADAATNEIIAKRLQGWNESSFSKQLDTHGLIALT